MMRVEVHCNDDRTTRILAEIVQSDNAELCE